MEEPLETTYDMFLSWFRLISISSLGYLMKITYKLYCNNFTLFYLLLCK